MFGGSGNPAEWEGVAGLAVVRLEVCIASAILSSSALCCKLGMDCSAL